MAAAGVPPTLGLATEARLLLAGLRARRGAARRDWTPAPAMCSPRSRAGGRARASSAGCAPARHARGGFFAGSPRPTAGPRSSRACRRGAARRGSGRPGSAARSSPGRALPAGAAAAVVRGRWRPCWCSRARRRRGRGSAAAGVRCGTRWRWPGRSPTSMPTIRGAGGFPPARDCGPVPVPRRAGSAGRWGSRRARAGDRRERRAVEAGWAGSRPSRRGRRCLATWTSDGQRPARPSADGDARLRPRRDRPGGRRPAHGAALRRPGRAAATEMAEVYATVFRAKGQDVDPAAVLRSAQAHFAARYRDLRFFSARRSATFDAALALSRELVDARPAERPGRPSFRAGAHPI